MNCKQNDTNNEAKQIKIDELRSLDIYPHIKVNIVNYLKNCREPLNENSFYCFSCKHSVCSECGLLDHKDHILIQRENCLKYDNTFFTDLENVINESLLLKKKKEGIKDTIINSINKLHSQLEKEKELKLIEVDKLFEEIELNMKELKENLISVKQNIEEYYKKNERFFNLRLNNVDQENSIFLINFELMNLCDIKNIEVMNSINKMNDCIELYDKLINDKTDNAMREIEHYLDYNYSLNSVDDFYWDVKIRTQKYSDHIKSFKSSIFNIIKTQGSYDKLNDLVDIFDSKNKRGIDLILNQDYFLTKQNNFEQFSFRKMKIRGNSKSYLLTQSKSGLILTSKQKYNSLAQPNSQSQKNIHLNPFSHIHSVDDITLDNKIVQRFFTYTLLDIYAKLFAQLKEKNHYTPSCLMINFAERINQLKEYAKPIIGTNEISVYNKKTHLINRLHLNLEKDIHGYTAFPDGCRHILIENSLYIIGGVDAFKNKLNDVLCFDIKTNNIERLNSLLNPHAYHSIEYLDNYDCLIVIGGETSNACEMFDLTTQLWTRLPDMNYPRANVNIYYDNVTSDIYALFGMENAINENMIYSSIIEVLELKDIISGWFKVDYYKSADLNFKINYCSVIPFSKETLLIYGGNKSRTQKKLFALYHLTKNEVLKVDEKIMEEIKLEEKKIRALDIALDKIK